ncbi:YpoC family protein, partial [Planomicrobium okeanokoites]|uniref:YpoC family protein n=1 Tax=Planomicrobium okeanokoites TaxID=244 RepID=UPI0030FAE688
NKFDKSREIHMITPLNNEERLAFVEMNCRTFAAYRQLQELFNEMQKKIASKRAILNRNND